MNPLAEAVLEFATECYGISPTQITPMSGGHVTHVYEFPREGRECVLRITPPNEEIDLEATRAILAWMHYLGERGASVAGPIPSVNGRLIEIYEGEVGDYLIVAFDKAPGVLAEELSFDFWNAELFKSLGRAIGEMHTLSREYIPQEEALRRPDWEQIGNCFNSTGELDDSQASVRTAREEVLAYVGTLPKDGGSYGLIHADLHSANFYVDVESGKITLFDFDDCAYGWYVMDIAMILFDMLVLYTGEEREVFAADLLRSLLEGYLSKTNMEAFWIEQLPNFLKLLEIGVYTDVYKLYEPGDTESWIGKFMPGRQARIEGRIPYIDIGFSAILTSI